MLYNALLFKRVFPLPYVYVEKKKKGKGHWDQKKKLEVCQAYILLGQIRLTAATCNIPEITLQYWRKQQWWKEMEDELRRASKLQLSGKLSELVNKSLSVLEDRLENGDFMWNQKTGEFIRKQVDASTTLKVAAMLIDRTLAVEKAAVPEKLNDASVEARLAQLRKEMMAFARPPTQFPPVVFDAEVVKEPNAQLSNEADRSDQGLVDQPGSQGGEQAERQAPSPGSPDRYGYSGPSGPDRVFEYSGPHSTGPSPADTCRGLPPDDPSNALLDDTDSDTSGSGVRPA